MMECGHGETQMRQRLKIQLLNFVPVTDVVEKTKDKMKQARKGPQCTPKDSPRRSENKAGSPFN